MEKVRYMISDAANLAHVEAHVLRYWEEELDLAIPRNEMGHRYYTRENIEQFQKIKQLKEQGYQLKAIRMILHNGKDGWNTVKDIGNRNSIESREATEPQIAKIEKAAAQYDKEQDTGEPAQMMVTSQETSVVADASRAVDITADERMAQFRELMSDIVGHAIALNNEELSENIGREVGERVLKEMDYLVREQDETQEERFRKLDEAIRGSIRMKKPLFSGHKADKPKKPSRKEKKERVKAPDPALT